MVGRMPSRKAPAIISVDAKICLLFPVGSWHLLDSPGTGQKLGTLYRGRGQNRAAWLLRLRLSLPPTAFTCRAPDGMAGTNVNGLTLRRPCCCGRERL